MQKLENEYSPAPPANLPANPEPGLDAPGVETATVPLEFDGLRLDAAAARLFDHHSRARLKGWIEAGRERIDAMRPIAERRGLSMLQLA